MSYRSEKEIVEDLRTTENFYSQRRILYLESGKNFNEEQIKKLLNKTDKQLELQIKHWREVAKKLRIEDRLYCQY